MLAGLTWIGARARWALALGVPAAMLIPGPGAVLAGSIPIWVAVLFGLAMTRIDLGALLRRAVGPRRLIRNLALLVLLMGGTPVLAWTIGQGLGLPPALVQALVYTTAAPPLGSATAFCLMLGLDAAFALELTVLGSFLAPFTMPLVARVLLGEAVPVDVLEMMVRLGIVIGGATVMAIVLRGIMGADRITRHGLVFDGISSCVLVLFLFPLFNGMPALMGAEPVFAVIAFAAAMIANLGVQTATYPVTRAVAGRDTGGAASLIWGNRNAALTLAFLPEAPLIVLYIALYQFPMYVTPLVMRWVVGHPAPEGPGRPK